MRPRSDSPRVPVPARPTVANPFHPWILGALAAMFVCRPLMGTDVPSASPWHFWHTELGVPPGLRQGLMVSLLWLVLAAVWCMGHLSSGRRWRPHAADLAMALLLVFHSISAVWAIWHAAPRPALNSLWIWLGMGAAYFVVRLAISSPREARGLLAVMISLAVSLGSYGLYQHFVELPETRARYEQDRERLMREAGLANVMADPGARQAYENRVQSREPFGTFALANSLAGFLTPWLVVVVGLVIRRILSKNESQPAGEWPSWGLLTFLLIVLVTCLLTTKSRSAWLGSLAGIGLLGLGLLARRVGAGLLRGLAIGALALGLLAALGVWTGSLDAKVLTESNKSLRYRFEYWQGSLGIIGEHPWAGCGPGNFRDAYTQYKLPQASEEVADPHNLFVEVWATAGTPALLALVALYATLAVALLRTPTVSPAPSAGSPPAGKSVSATPAAEAEADPTLAFSFGAVAGLFLGWFLTLTIEMPLTEWFFIPSLAIVPLVMYALRPWILSGSAAAARDDARLAACGIAALTVNLLAAGGISFPGVADSLWLLMGLCITCLVGWPVESTRAPISRVRTWVCLAALLGMIGLCYFTAYLPVSRQSLALRQASQSREPEPLLLMAEQADPLSDTGAMALAEFYFERWLAASDPADLKQFESWKDRGLALRPQSFTGRQDVSNWWTRANQHSPHPAYLESAERSAAQAVALYPNSASARHHWAVAAWRLGTEPARAIARREASEALRLHALTPHDNKKLPPEQLQALERMISGR